MRYGIKDESGKVVAVINSEEPLDANELEEARREFESGKRPIPTTGPEQMIGGAGAPADLPLPLRAAARGIETALPVESVRALGAMATGSQPYNLADIAGASLGLGAAAIPASRGLGAAAKLLGAGAAGAGAAGAGLEVLKDTTGIDNPALNFLAPAIAGGGAAFAAAPQTALRAIRSGEEANALARAAQGMGLPVAEVAPQGKGIPWARTPEVRRVWEEARKGLGERVGETKRAAMKTEIATGPEVASVVGADVRAALAEAGVPKMSGALVPAGAPNKAAAQMVIDNLSDLGVITPKTSPEQAMTIANNILERVKKQVSESGRFSEGLGGDISTKATAAWQKALDSLSPEDALAAHQDANKAFAKIATLQDMVESSAKGKGAGETPMFRPKDFLAQWEGMDNALKESVFSPGEIAALDLLTGQRRTLTQRVTGVIPNMLQNVRLRQLSFHPQTRFYENVKTPFTAANVAPATAQGFRSAAWEEESSPSSKLMKALLRSRRKD